MRSLSRLLLPALLVLVGLLLWRGTWEAGWISEDASVVRHLSEHGGLADWWQSQYGMHAIAFWRPLVSTTLWAQIEVFGPDPLPLRAFNALCQVVAALLMFRLARRLGCRTWGSLAAALLTLTFPHQGGTVTWIVGRVDSLCWPLMLGALLGVASGRARTAALCAVLALATKEMAVALAPAAIAVARTWPREQEREQVRRAERWVLVALAATWLWRWFAVGEFVGGYPGRIDFSEPFSSLAAGFVVLGPVAFVLPFAAVLGRAGDVVVARPIAVGLVGAAAALFVLMPLLTEGMNAEHRRWLAVPDGLVCLAWAGCCGRAPWTREAPRVLPVLALLLGSFALIGVRFAQARDSVTTWAAAAGQVQAFVARAEASRDALDVAPSPVPLLVGDVPRLDTTNRAYTLHLGLTDHFRPPLGASPRPLWPWRSIYGVTRIDPPASGPGAHLDPPLFDPLEHTGTLEVEGPRELFIEGTDTKRARWVSDEPNLAVVLMTELGHEYAPLRRPEADGYSPERLFGSVGATELWRTLVFASDFGSRRAYFAFVTPDGRASDWIHVHWDEATVAALSSVLTP